MYMYERSSRAASARRPSKLRRGVRGYVRYTGTGTECGPCANYKGQGAVVSPGMAVSSVYLQLRDHPELQPLILHDVTPTGVTIGAGAFGNIEEVAIPGAVCAAKSIHHFLAEEEEDWVAKDVVDKNIRKFVAECKIMGRLRHPNIVQFLGLWFSQPKELCVPAIVMEKMHL